MTLWHALEHLEGDDVLREGLGKTPEGDYVDYFVVDQARRGPGLPRRGHALGARPLPAGLLTAMPPCATADRVDRPPTDAHPNPAIEEMST